MTHVLSVPPNAKLSSLIFYRIGRTLPFNFDLIVFWAKGAITDATRDRTRRAKPGS